MGRLRDRLMEDRSVAASAVEVGSPGKSPAARVRTVNWERPEVICSSSSLPSRLTAPGSRARTMTVEHDEAGATRGSSSAAQGPSMADLGDFERTVAVHGGRRLVLPHDRTRRGSVVNTGSLRHRVLDAAVVAFAAGQAMPDERRAAVLVTPERV